MSVPTFKPWFNNNSKSNELKKSKQTKASIEFRKTVNDVKVCYLLLLVYACAGSFVSFLAGRLVHGIASAFTSIAALSILAELYSSDLERSKVMGVAMGGVAFGVVGKP